MTQHSFLQNLLQGQAVEWKTLGEVCDILDNLRKPIKASLRLAGSNPYYGANNIQDYVDGFTHDGEYVLIAEDGSSSLENYSIQWATGKFWANNHVHVVSAKECLNNRFLFHFLKKMNFIPYLTGGTRAKLTKAKMIEIQIPIPPLSVQSQIVQILDTFTELTDQLTTELSMRQKQYQYYRDLLLTFDEKISGGGSNPFFCQNVLWKTLGEVGELVRGNGLTKKDLTDDGVPAIHYGQIYTRYGLSTEKTLSFVSTELAKRLRKVDTGDVVITNTSENLADVGKSLVYLGKEQAVTGGHATIFKPNKQIILGKYFAYFTQTDNFATQKRKYAKGTKVIDVSTNDMAKLKIPIPPLSIQSQIVAILDKFDTLVNSISEGLPKEIKLHQKQYEYYRERLLAF